ncbi:MAG: diphosphate--fructose-6-phosphate 1-phosphotransferase [Planctomycetota bacterium]
MSRLKGRALIGQSGGPTAVINQSLVGVIEAALAADEITDVVGAENGIQGVLDGRLVDLGREDRGELERVARTPAAALGSVRKKPSQDDCARIVDALERNDIRYVFYIGGNDSAETAFLLNNAAAARGYEVRLFHVPKTIDNDLAAQDHTPGYGSAARFVAQAMMGVDADNRSLGGVKVDVIMGRHAGWLTAAARLARTVDGDGPHLIYVPEVAFDIDSFLGRVGACVADYGRCVIAVSEGIHLADGTLVAEVGASGQREVDSHGNVQLSGTGALGDKLAAWIKEGVPAAKRVRADTYGYLQRSYFGVVSEQDAREAREVGHVAVRVATSGERPHGSIAIQRDLSSGAYRPRYEVIELEDVAQRTRCMSADLLLGDCDVSPTFLDYALPLVGELPRPGRLARHRFVR